MWRWEAWGWVFYSRRKLFTDRWSLISALKGAKYFVSEGSQDLYGVVGLAGEVIGNARYVRRKIKRRMRYES